MKPKKTNMLPPMLAALAILVAAAFLIIGQHPPKTTAIENPSAMQAHLLKEAMDRVGVQAPNDAAILWADGVRERSAALQYAAMTHDLRLQYEKQLETTAPNWVTGVSSPWIARYRIRALRLLTPDDAIADLVFQTADSTGHADFPTARLYLAREGDFFRVAAIDMDPELTAYTGWTSESIGKKVDSESSPSNRAAFP